jgi:hypothetical protein
MVFNIVGVWVVTVLAVVLGTLAAVQAASGRRTYPFTPRHTDWSIGELKLLGVCWAIYCYALALYVLVGGLLVEMHAQNPFGLLTAIPFVLAATLIQGLTVARHNRRWPFKRQISRS